MTYSDANFTPSLKGYSEVKPFKFWCQKVLPLVYDDSLSYYELLCKITDYINKIIEDLSASEDNIGDLLTAYNQLQDYVNNYFSNLDVQEEINNKLDAMVEDGELTNIIETYLNPYVDSMNATLNTFSENMNQMFAEQNSTISTLSESVNSIILGNTTNLSGTNINVVTGETSGASKTATITIPSTAIVLEVTYSYISGDDHTIKTGNSKTLETISGDNKVLTIVIQDDNLAASLGMTVYVKYSIVQSVTITELTDLRVSFDGKTYATAGESVRTQTYYNYANIFAKYINLFDNKFTIPAFFVRGSFTGGGVLSDLKYRARAAYPIVLPRNMTFNIASGFKIRYIYYDKTTGDMVSTTSWTTGTVALTTQYSIMPMIARETEDTAEIIDLVEFISAITAPLTDSTVSVSGSPADAGAVRELVDTISIQPASYNNKLSDVNINARGNVLSSGGWTDLPTGHTSGIFTNHHVTGTFDLQTYVSNVYGDMFTRVVRRNNRELYRDWLPVTKDKINLEDKIKNLKVVVLGDSIARGGRNQGKGFVGDIGCEYVNLGIGGATISNVVNSSSSTDSVHPIGALNIADSIIKYSQSSNESWYIIPDVIIASGGLNDYLRDAELGTVPSTVIHNDTEASALTLSRVSDSLQYMFYQMVKLYPASQRVFVTTNKVYNHPWTPHYTGGYTQTDLHDLIVKVCQLYGVKVVDVFNDSILNSYFDQYVSSTPYSEDHSVTDTQYIDSDKLHPLSLGYKTGYEPLVKATLISCIKTE